MPGHDWTPLLYEMLDYARRARRYAFKLDVHEFKKNDVVFDATLRNLEKFGQAASRMPENAKVLFAQTPWRDIEALGRRIFERVRHDRELVWNTAVWATPPIILAFQDYLKTNMIAIKDEDVLNRDEVLKILRERRSELEAMNVTSAALFGSVVRGEAQPDSDVDIMIEVKQGTSLFDFFNIQEALQKWIGTEVDLIMGSSLRPAIRDRVMKEAVDAW